MYAPHRLLKRVYYIREFLNIIQSDNKELFVLDEAGNFLVSFLILGKDLEPLPSLIILMLL